MSRLLRVLLPLASAPLLASCMLLLDFDDLKSNAGEPAAAGGTPDAGGNANANPEAGAGAPPAAGAGGSSCGDCDDGDPCTADSCDETGSAPACVHETTPHLALDGIDTVLHAEQHVRVSLAASANSFYLAALEVDKKVPEITLYRLASDGTELETLDKLSSLPLDGTVISNVGLAVDPTLGGLDLHGFVAVKPALGDAQPKIVHLVTRNGKTTTQLVAGSSYKADNPWVFPQALAIGNRVVGAWIQADGSVAVHELIGGTTTFGDPALPATTLALLSTSDDHPAVLFTAESNGAALGTYLETGGKSRTKVSECQTANGSYVSSSVIATQIPGVWLGNITKASDQYLTKGGATLVCAKNTCVATTDTCQPDDLANSVRDVAGATVHFDTDAPGIVYSVIAIPQLAPKPDSPSEVVGKLSLAFGQADFSGNKSGDATQLGDLLEIANMDTDASLGFAGPDWPAVGILPTEQVAVAWIQPNPGEGGSDLHVQRYKLCLPPP
jgi:hypothetical protein